MYLYKTITVASGTGEVLSDALSGLGEKKRKIIALLPSLNPATGGPSTAVRVRGYRDQFQVVDYDHDLWRSGDSDTTDYLAVPRLIPIDLTLERGQGFQLGFYHASSTPAGKITIQYEDLE